MMLALFFAVFAAAEAQNCRGMSESIQRQMPLFARQHQNMKLKQDCNATMDAYYSAYLIASGQPTHVGHYWCHYSRFVWEIWPEHDPFSKLYDKENNFLDLPIDKPVFYGYYFVPVCIYQRLGRETRCFCN
ncbi:hypothetical protein Q1695_016248 [Nippostrongylus brasiliensis]|nr:hypothetical protein Q1695_016248 [Nippostrongylus brasiliensis]